MKTVGMFEAKTQFSALVDAAVHGETVIVTKNGKPVAQIVPVADTTPRPFGFDRAIFLSGAVKIEDGFDDLPPELLKAFYGE